MKSHPFSLLVDLFDCCLDCFRIHGSVRQFDELVIDISQWRFMETMCNEQCLKVQNLHAIQLDLNQNRRFQRATVASLKEVPAFEYPNLSVLEAQPVAAYSTKSCGNPCPFSATGTYIRLVKW